MKIFKLCRISKKKIIFGLFGVLLILIIKILCEHIFYSNIPTIFAITATYARYEQLAELNRLMNTFLHIKNFHWVVVEDSSFKSNSIKKFLKESGISYTHLNSPTPQIWKIKGSEAFWSKPKGINQRNAGLDWIRKNAYKLTNQGVVYIADDDNSYTIRLFNEMRYTKTVSTWPVGLAGELPWEGCVGNGNGGVSKFWVAFKPDRPFPVDMAGFAVNLELIIRHPSASFSYNASIGYQESIFLEKLNVNLSDLESKADDCKRILVWHLRTARPLMREGYQLSLNGIKAPEILDEFYSEF